MPSVLSYFHFPTLDSALQSPFHFHVCFNNGKEVGTAGAFCSHCLPLPRKKKKKSSNHRLSTPHIFSAKNFLSYNVFHLYKPTRPFCFFLTFHLYNCGGSKLHVGFPKASTRRFSPAPPQVTHPGGRSNREERCLRLGSGRPPSAKRSVPPNPTPQFRPQGMDACSTAETRTGML